MRLLVLGATWCLLAACSGESSASGGDAVDPADPWGAAYEQAIENSSSEFVRQVLEDHQIADAELAESQDSLVACLREQGFEPLVTTDQGRRTVSVPANADGSCEDLWAGPIESLYWEQRRNPENADEYALVAACLVRTGLAPEQFTGDDLAELVEQSTEHSVYNGDTGELISSTPAADPDPRLPSGMGIAAPETQQCWVSPLTTGVD